MPGVACTSRALTLFARGRFTRLLLNFLLLVTASEFAVKGSHAEEQLHTPTLATPVLTDRHLDRFIVVPEYKLLFCYVEKVRAHEGARRSSLRGSSRQAARACLELSAARTHPGSLVYPFLPSACTHHEHRTLGDGHC